jgi:hypothetical protein
MVAVLNNSKLPKTYAIHLPRYSTRNNKLANAFSGSLAAHNFGYDLKPIKHKRDKNSPPNPPTV